MKKVVLLGDSIRQIGYGTKVPMLLGEEYEVWQPEENCRFAQYTLRGLYEWREHLEGSDVIHWNNGLWDIGDIFQDGPFTRSEIYVETMLRIAGILLTISPRVIFATTTPVATAMYESAEEQNARIREYNSLLVPKLKEMGVQINDLYEIVSPKISEYLREDDKVHLSDAGIDACAEAVVRAIRAGK